MGILCESAVRDGSVYQRTGGDRLESFLMRVVQDVWRSSSYDRPESRRYEEPLSVPDEVRDVEQF